jgi:hypothetical protein
VGEDDDLRLNTLHRFEKGAGRLTLREYSHCEVPAGCGGVVMRFLDPDDPPPVCVEVVVLGSADTWLDGERLTSSFTRMRGGHHLVAVHLPSSDLRGVTGSRHRSRLRLPSTAIPGATSIVQRTSSRARPIFASAWRRSRRA